MHELHLIEPIIKSISEHAEREGAAAVTKIRLKIGELCGIKEESFREIFSLLARGTILENSQIELKFFPGTTIEVLPFDIE